MARCIKRPATTKGSVNVLVRVREDRGGRGGGGAERERGERERERGRERLQTPDGLLHFGRGPIYKPQNTQTELCAQPNK